jgi:hypothetical protein
MQRQLHEITLTEANSKPDVNLQSSWTEDERTVSVNSGVRHSI